MKKVLVFMACSLVMLLAFVPAYLSPPPASGMYNAGTVPLMLMKSYISLNTKLIAEPGHTTSDRHKTTCQETSAQSIPAIRPLIPVIIEGLLK